MPAELLEGVFRQLEPDVKELGRLRLVRRRVGSVAEQFSKTKSNTQLNKNKYMERAYALIEESPTFRTDDMIGNHKEFHGATGDYLRMVAYSEYTRSPDSETHEQREAGGVLHERAAAYHGLNPDLKQKAARFAVAERLSDMRSG